MPVRLSGTYIGGSFAEEDLSDAILDGTFIGVNFTRASLCRAELVGVFVMVNFSEANLRDAYLEAKSFIGVRLNGAILPDGSMVE